MCKQKNSFTLYELRSGMVREVGFEPTNPYGTGASGLRVQDPTLLRRVSLTWLGNTSRPMNKADSRKHQARSRKNTRPRQGPNWLSPIRQSIKSGQCLIEPRREPHPTRNPAYPKLTGNMSPWPPVAEKHDAYEAVVATAGDDPDNTETAGCKAVMETPDGNATGEAASYATAGRSEKPASHQSIRNTSE